MSKYFDTKPAVLKKHQAVTIKEDDVQANASTDEKRWERPR